MIDPAYHDMGDHTETIQVEFDPSKISYEKLLSLFWENHNSTSRSSTQYMSAAWYHNDDQKNLILKSKSKFEKENPNNGKIVTKIAQAVRFYPAEGYHQKYYLRGKTQLMEHFKELPLEDFINSTIAAKVNGYLGGYGTLEQLEKEVDSFHLSSDSKSFLISLVKKKQSSGGCFFKPK